MKTKNNSKYHINSDNFINKKSLPKRNNSIVVRELK